MPDAAAIFERLRGALPAISLLPEDCWIVGGSLRDAMLGVGPKDLDCAAPRASTAAESFASRTGGRKVCLAKSPLETWRVVFNGLDWDFTDIDGGAIEADLGRRDFTIGALALSVHRPHILLDPFSGARDIERRIVRMVSTENLKDDPVRMIRGVRLAGRLGFEIDEETRECIVSNTPLLRNSAAERITSELDAIITCREVRPPLELLMATGLDNEVFAGGLDEDAVRRCAAIFSPDAVTRYAALFVGREDRLPAHAEGARWSRDRRRDVAALLEFVSTASRDDANGRDQLPLLVHDYGVRTGRRASELLAALGRADKAKRLEVLVRERGTALADMRPILNGVEIRELLGLEDGPLLGRTSRLLVEAQIRGEVRTRNDAIMFLRKSVAKES